MLHRTAGEVHARAGTGALRHPGGASAGCGSSRSSAPVPTARPSSSHEHPMSESAFTVRHTEGYTALMEEIWRFED